MKSTETYSVQRSMNNTRKLITSHYFVQYTFITERSCISQLSIRIMNHALRLASTVIKTQKNTIVYIDIQCKILMQKYCAYLFFYKKKHCTMVTSIVSHFRSRHVVHSNTQYEQYYSSGGKQYVNKTHNRQWQNADESPKRGF